MEGGRSGRVTPSTRRGRQGIAEKINKNNIYDVIVGEEAGGGCQVWGIRAFGVKSMLNELLRIFVYL